ncbi:hypothetical protein EW145_g1135 [Phellinidium pouzarii]|uniref:Uncharacterized protein n=1 Tax=Phellinidium pouzarii TaxID=167371 RepID=A0A4S4LG51_9AGAM|nr:hypothetical protein EW145_g1135 [Phellinidium pouzarii]
MNTKMVPAGPVTSKFKYPSHSATGGKSDEFHDNRSRTKIKGKDKEKDKEKDGLYKSTMRKGASKTRPGSAISEKQDIDRTRPLAVVANDVQASNLPDPIPASDAFSSSTLQRTTLTVLPTFTMFTADTVISSQDSVEPFSYLRSTTTVWVYASETNAPQSSILSASVAAQSSSVHTLSHLPMLTTVLVVVGATSLALVSILVLRCFCRRKKRTEHPTPSNPILQDSPLFGGKERFSRGLWADPSFGNLFNTHNKNGKGEGWRPLSGGKYAEMDQAHEKTPAAFLSVNNSAPSPVSPASVYTTAAGAPDIGIALEFPLPDNSAMATQPLKIKAKGGQSKAVRRRSVTTSMYGGGAGISSSTFTETETGVAYRTPRPAPTPGKPKPVIKTSGPMRERAQAPYRKNIPTTSSRSSLYRSTSRSEKEKDEPFMYALPMVKSEERRDRDTKALTSALGLASPPPPSSCFSPVSIYPDDSLSVAHGHRSMRPMSEAPPSEMPSPTGTHAALGSLMLQEFPSTATFASLRTGDPFADLLPKKKAQAWSSSDKPPRVPSPPRLPSLSQMAMAQADPDYRSPTYSIYGLYEAQRKSKTSFAN